MIRLDSSGVRVLTAPDQPAENTYDSVNSLLLNTSPGFVKHFNASLAASLKKAAEEGEYRPRWLETEDE